MARYGLIDSPAPGGAALDERIFVRKGALPGSRGEKVSFRAVILNFAQNVVGSSSTSIKTTRIAQSTLLVVLTLMYLATFAVGLYLFVFTVVKGINGQTTPDKLAGLGFAGLSAGTFVAVFIVRPTSEISRVNIANLWSSLTANSYWSRVAFDLQETTHLAARDRHLREATDDALRELAGLYKWSERFDKSYLKRLEAESNAALGLMAQDITVVSPSSPAELPTGKGAVLEGIAVSTTPGGLGILWSVTGDLDGSLAQTRPGVFTYARGSAADGDVTLHFALAADPSVGTDLHVLAPSGAPTTPGSIQTDPTSPAELAANATELPISLRVNPKYAPVTGTVSNGDSSDALEKQPDGTFKYVRGANPAADVTLHFELTEDKSVATDLHIVKPKA